jgi:hypothetical protein
MAVERAFDDLFEMKPEGVVLTRRPVRVGGDSYGKGSTVSGEVEVAGHKVKDWPNRKIWGHEEKGEFVVETVLPK